MDGAGRSRGATLLELIAVIVLLAVAIPALLAWVNASLRGAGLESESVRIAQLGQQRMEVLLVAKRTGRLQFSHPESFQESCDAALDTFDGAAALTVPAGYTLNRPICVLDEGQGRGEISVTISGPRLSRQYHLEVYGRD